MVKDHLHLGPKITVSEDIPPFPHTSQCSSDESFYRLAVTCYFEYLLEKNQDEYSMLSVLLDWGDKEGIYNFGGEIL